METTSVIVPILRTKLHRPRRTGTHVHRGAILSRLDRFMDRPLILVSAPAGYGKSSLVSCWLEGCDVPSTWVSLDAHDNDLRTFLAYFVAAIQAIFPAACRETLTILRCDPLPPATLLANRLANELDRIETTFVLTLDDYHLIRDSHIHEFMIRLLEHSPAAMRLVLMGRWDPPLPLTSLRAKGKMIEIRSQDLRFSLHETAVFFEQATGIPVDDAVAAILEEKTEGWVTGLRLTALSLGRRRDLKGILTDLPLNNRYVRDYLVTEILSQQQPAVRKCLLKTAVLRRFCASLCDAVCRSGADAGEGDISGREFLEVLENANLFSIPLDDERQWYRYHHLFRSLLERQLKQKRNGEQIAGLHMRASAWFAENGSIEEALWHAHQSGDKAAAAKLVKRHRHEIMNREQWYYLNKCLQGFPPDFILQDPDLMMVRAWTLQRQARYRELFEVLEQLNRCIPDPAAGSGDDGMLWAELQALRSFQYYSTARGELSANTALEAINRLPAGYHSVRGLALVVRSLSLQMLGDFGQARRVVLEALREERVSTNVYKSMLLVALSFSSWIAADLNSLKQTADQLLKHGRKYNLPETTTVARFFSGIRHYQLNQLDLAEYFLAPIVGITGADEPVVPNVVTHCQGAFALSLTYLAMGRSEEASSIVNSLIGYLLETGNPDLLELCQAFKAELALRQGNVAEADFWARNEPPAPLAPAFRFYNPYLTLPKVLLARPTAKSLNRAETLLSQMGEFYSSIHSTLVMIDVHILQALIHHAQGSTLQADEKLKLALSQAEPGGLIRPFLDHGPNMEELLGRLVRQKPSLPYAKKILLAFGRAGTASSRDPSKDRARSRPPVGSAPMIEPLTQREFEVLRILAKGASNKDIARGLFISTETVKRHLSTIYGKLGVKSRNQAVIRAKSIGIL